MTLRSKDVKTCVHGVDIVVHCSACAAVGGLPHNADHGVLSRRMDQRAGISMEFTGRPSPFNEQIVTITKRLNADEIEHVRALMEKAFNVGWEQHRDEIAHQEQDPDYPITRNNPYTKETFYGAH